MENLVASLAFLSNPQLIAAVEKKYQDAETEKKRLQQELATVTATGKLLPREIFKHETYNEYVKRVGKIGGPKCSSEPDS